MGRILFLHIVSIFSIILRLVASGACPEANFPIQIGGPNDETVIKAIDYHAATKKLAAVGYTKCSELKKDNDGVSDRLPLIIHYTDDGKIDSPDWGYTLAL